MSISLFPCEAVVTCGPCPTCTVTVYDVLGLDHAGTRIGRLVYVDKGTYDVSASLSYLDGTTLTAIGLTVLPATHKICLSQNASSVVINGSKFYALAVPVNAVLKTISITTDTPTADPVTVTYEIKACENGLQATASMSSTECWSPIVTTVATACGAAATDCSTAVLVKQFQSNTPGCDNTNWPAASGVTVSGKFYAPCGGVDVDFSNAVKSMAAARTCTFTVSRACANNNDPTLSFGFSGTILGPTGSVSVAGGITRAPGGVYTLTISSAVASADTPTLSTSQSGCSGAPACPAAISQVISAELGRAQIPCSSSYLIVKATATFGLGRIGGSGGGACCLCSDSSISGGGAKQVMTSSILSYVEVWVGP